MLAPPSRASAPKGLAAQAGGVPGLELPWKPRTVSAFYGTALPRPYLLLDKTSGEVKTDRLAPPKVNDALLGASQAPGKPFPLPLVVQATHTSSGSRTPPRVCPRTRRLGVPDPVQARRPAGRRRAGGWPRRASLPAWRLRGRRRRRSGAAPRQEAPLRSVLLLPGTPCCPRQRSPFLPAQEAPLRRLCKADS